VYQKSKNTCIFVKVIVKKSVAPFLSGHGVDVLSVFQLKRLFIVGGGGMAVWFASPDWDPEVLDSNPGVARSDGQ